MIDVVGLLVLIVLALVFGFLASRAWRVRNRLVRWLGVILLGLLTLIPLLIAVLALIGFGKFNAKQSNPVANIQVAGTAEQVARGEKLANFCGCHMSNNTLPLSGGTDNFGNLGGLPLGTIYPPNLTPAGPLKNWSDGEIVRAFREGVHQNGRALIVMPADIYHNLSDEDAQALLAYLRSQPAVQHDLPDNSLTVLGAALVGSGAFPLSVQPPITQPQHAPPAGVTVEYGNYLVNIAACRACHGENLTGGTGANFAPIGPNLTQIVPKWSDADFLKTIRTGTDPSGHKLDADQMPYPEFAKLSDDDLKAIYTYIRSLPPK